MIGSLVAMNVLEDPAPVRRSEFRFLAGEPSRCLTERHNRQQQERHYQNRHSRCFGVRTPGIACGSASEPGVLRLRLAIRFALRQTPLRMTGIESEARRQGPSVRAWEHPPVIVAAVAQSRGDVVGLPEGKLRTAGADAEFSEVV